MLPPEVETALVEAVKGLNFGKVVLEIIYHDQHPKYRIVREISIIPGKKSSGAKGADLGSHCQKLKLS